MDNDSRNGRSAEPLAERGALAQHLNEKFAGVKTLERYLPLTRENILQRCEDAVLIAFFIASVKPTAVAMSKMHLDIDIDQLNNKKVKIPGSQHIFRANENAHVALKGAAALGIKLVNIGAEDIVSGNETLVLGLMWQILRAELLANISLTGHPELVRILEDGESLLHLCQEGPEAVLMRWFNYHLKRAGSDRVVTNWTTDLKDSECYLKLIGQIGKKLADHESIAEALQTTDMSKRAYAVIYNADKLQCNKFITASDIVNGRAQFNLAFTANLFNNHIGIRLPTEEEVEELRKIIDRLKMVLRAHGIRLDEDDYESIRALEAGERSVMKLIARCEALEKQAEQDDERIFKMEQMLKEAQTIIGGLSEERDKAYEINKSLLERQKRQDEKMGMINKRLRDANLTIDSQLLTPPAYPPPTPPTPAGPAEQQQLTPTKTKSKKRKGKKPANVDGTKGSSAEETSSGMDSGESTPTASSESLISPLDETAGDVMSVVEKAMTKVLPSDVVEEVRKETEKEEDPQEAFMRKLSKKVVAQSNETTKQIADLEQKNEQVRKVNDAMFSKVEQIASALAKGKRERACANCGKRCTTCKNKP